MCVWEQKTKPWAASSQLCACVCEITLLLHTSMFIITQKHTPLIHVITTSPLATLSNQPSVCLSLSLSPRLSFSVKVGLISIKQDLSCNPVKWACDGNNPAQDRLTPCKSVSVFLFLEKLISCHLKMFLCDRGNTRWSMEDQFVCVVRTSHSHPLDIPLPVSDTLPTTWSVKMCLRMRTRMCLTEYIWLFLELVLI